MWLWSHGPVVSIVLYSIEQPEKNIFHSIKSRQSFTDKMRKSRWFLLKMNLSVCETIISPSSGGERKLQMSQSWPEWPLVYVSPLVCFHLHVMMCINSKYISVNLNKSSKICVQVYFSLFSSRSASLLHVFVSMCIVVCLCYMQSPAALWMCQKYTKSSTQQHDQTLQLQSSTLASNFNVSHKHFTQKPLCCLHETSKKWKLTSNSLISLSTPAFLCKLLPNNAAERP